MAATCLVSLGIVHAAAVRAHAAETRQARSIAVLPFRNLQSDKSADAIGERAAEVLTSELADRIEPPPVEFARLKELLAKENLKPSDLSDTAVAARIARLAGAARAVIGTYVVDGDVVRFTVHVVDAPTGRTITNWESTNSRQQIVDAFLQLTDDVVRSFHSRAPTAPGTTAPPEPVVEHLTWSRTTLFDGKGYAWLSAAVPVSDGYIVVGTHDHKGLAIKLDAKGAKQWERNYSCSPHDELHGARQTRDGGYVLVGLTSGDKGNDGLLIKTSAKGEEEWHRVFTGRCDVLRGVAEIDGGYIVAGSTTGNEFGYVVKTDSAGKKTAEATFGTPKSLNTFNSIRRVEGGFVATGCTGAGGWDRRHGWAVVIDNELSKVRQKIYVSDGLAFLSDALPARDSENRDGYIFAGMKMTDGYRAFLMKTGAALNREWDKDFGGGSNELYPSLHDHPPGGWVLLAGNGAVFNTWISRIVVAERKSEGGPSGQ